MKVIDLLNKIANGEEVPRVIRISGFNFIFNNYSCIDLYYEEEESHINWLDFMSIDLSDEIEPIEDEFIDIEELDKEKFYGNRFPDNWEEEYIKKIDMLIINQKAIINKIKDSE